MWFANDQSRTLFSLEQKKKKSSTTAHSNMQTANASFGQSSWFSPCLYHSFGLLVTYSSLLSSVFFLMAMNSLKIYAFMQL